MEEAQGQKPETPSATQEGPKVGQESIGTDEKKTFTEDELQREVDRRIQQAMSKREKEDEARRQKNREEVLRREQKFEELLKMREQEIEQMRQERERERLQAETFKAFQDSGIADYARIFDEDLSTLEGRARAAETLKSLLGREKESFAKDTLTSVKAPVKPQTQTHGEQKPDISTVEGARAFLEKRGVKIH